MRAACQLELSMMQTCKPIPEKGDNGAILKQVFITLAWLFVKLSLIGHLLTVSSYTYLESSW